MVDVMVVQRKITIVHPDFKGPRINVLLQPDEETVSLPRPKNSRQLLANLGLAEETALVVRTGHLDVTETSCDSGSGDAVLPELLTPDRRIWPGDEIFVRKVGSTG